MNNTSTLNEGSYSDHGSGHNKNDINAYKRVPLLRSTRCLLKISGCSEMQTDTNECCVEAKPLKSLQDDTYVGTYACALVQSAKYKFLYWHQV